MSRLRLSIAVGDYDRIRPLFDGRVPIDGVDPVFLALSPEEIFFRAFRTAEFDICELSLSSFALTIDRGDSPYVGVPVFPSRAFRHTSIYVRKDRGIRTPTDLRGRRIGLPEYQLTANVWVRGLLDSEYGVQPSEIDWVRAGIEEPGRHEKIKFRLPDGVRVTDAPEGATLSAMLAAGEIDGLIGPRMPSCFTDDQSRVGWLFDDPTAEAIAYYRKTGIFPIMHMIGVRKDIVARHGWLPATLLKAFTEAKEVATRNLADTSATKVTLPFVEEQLLAARRLMGADFWSYGFAPNRHVLQAFLAQHHKQGLSSREIEPEEMVHPAAKDMVRI